MKKMNKLLKLSPMLLLPFANVSNATDIPVEIKFSTLPEITINEDQEINFGNILTLANSDTCEMLVGVATNTLSNTDEMTVAADLVASSATNKAPADGNAGTLNTSSSCKSPATSGVAVPGIYTITSFAGADLSITVADGSSTGGEIDFTPKGYAVTYGSDSTADTGRVELDNSAPISVSAPFAGDSNIVVTQGITKVALGGTITNKQKLTPGSTLDLTFEMNVVYN